MEARIWRDSTVYDPLSSDVQQQFVCYIDPDGILSDAFLIVFQYYIYIY